MTVQSLCRVKKNVIDSTVLPLQFAPSQASSSHNSNVDNYLQYCELDSWKPSDSESSLKKKSQSPLELEQFWNLNLMGHGGPLCRAL